MTSGGGILEQQAIVELRNGLRGELLTPADAGYEVAREAIIADAARRPALIVRCTGMGDVRLSLIFARRHNLIVHVRGGSLSIQGGAVSDDGLVLDLSPIRSMRTDPARRTVHVTTGGVD